MDYEQIKEKYADKVQERSNKIALAQSKIDRLTAMLDYQKEQRDSVQGVISAEAARIRNAANFNITNISKKLSDAQTELDTVVVGEDLIKNL